MHPIGYIFQVKSEYIPDRVHYYMFLLKLQSGPVRGFALFVNLNKVKKV